MIARRVDQATLESAARDTGVNLYQLRPAGRGWRFTLHTIGRPPRYGRYGFSRRQDGSRRRLPGRVCWHGHRDFLRAVYALAPDARIVTAFITYENGEDFEARHVATADRAVGSQADPVAYGDLCDCGPARPTCTRAWREAPDTQPAPYMQDVTGWAEERTITPEETAEDACAPDGWPTERWATYNKRYCDLIAGRS